jgi:hypothetical protein
MNPRSRQSSIHHLAAELATCQPAAPCGSRTRHVPNPSAPCASAPIAPAEASSAPANRRLASGAAAAPEVARSAQPGCNRARVAGQDAAAPGPPRPRGTPRLHATRFPPSVPQTNRPTELLPPISAARSRDAAHRCKAHGCAPGRMRSSHRGVVGTKVAQRRCPRSHPLRLHLPRRQRPPPREAAARNTHTSAAVSVGATQGKRRKSGCGSHPKA